MRFPVVFSIAVGFLMVVQWAFFILTGNVPEFSINPIEISFHIAVEMLTAAALITGGVSLLRSGDSARFVYLIAQGMLIYAVINSSGYFAQRGEWVFVLMFAVLLVLSVFSIVRIIRWKESG